VTGLGAGSLWLAVIVLGLYHGLNPSMGCPLAVANGLAARRGTAVFATAWPLGVGHFLAMAIVLVPFVLLAWYVEWSRAIRVGAGVAIVLFGIWRLLDRRHPRFLARVRPTQLAWWSLLVATAHGAGLMLVPIALGLCSARSGDASAHAMLARSMQAGLVTALGVAVVHTVTMIAAGVGLAWAVYRHLGLRFLTVGWLDLEAVWGASLVVTGTLSVLLAFVHG
jgi:hypothetical protein